MKQSILIVLSIILIIIFIVCISLINIRSAKNEIKRENLEYEKYLGKESSGTEVASLISKAIDTNERNNLEKNDKGYFIENEENSIKIDLKMTTVDKTYPMEEIYNNDITLFVQNFNNVKFKCTSIEYHKKTGRISNIIFEELN